MDISKVCFQYKGSRDYIHGTDMFNQLTSLFPDDDIKNVRFSVHGFVREVSCLLYMSKLKSDIDKIRELATRCQFQVGDAMCWMGLKPEASDSPVGRYDYDEDSLIKHCYLDKDMIVLEGISPYTFIETVVAMNKHLLEGLFPEAAGKWVFTRIDLPKLEDAQSGISLQFKHNMNFRLLKSDILVEGKKVGDLYFSLVK